MYEYKPESKIMCKISLGSNSICNGKLIIVGFSILGTIKTHEMPLKNYKLTLPSDQCFKKENCHTISNEAGNFMFKGVKPGEHRILIKSEDHEIDPEFQSINILNKHVRADIFINILRFSIKGKVVDNNNIGVPEVVISLDSENKTISDANGDYNLLKIESGTYTLEGYHDHLIFEPLSNQMITPSLTAIPDIKLSFIHVCGNVVLTEKDAEPMNPSDIIISLSSIPQSIKSSTTLEANGNFCFEVKPGTYEIFPASKISHTKLNLSPPTHKFKVENKPVLDLNFKRPRVSLIGEIQFLSDISTELKEKTSIFLISKNGATLEKQLKSQNRFEFENILMDEYEIKILNEELCWETSSFNAVLDHANTMKSINFKQSGYSIPYETDIPIKAILESKALNYKGLVEFDNNENHVCVEKNGEYKLIPDSCFLLTKPYFVVNTNQKSKNGLLNLNPKGFQINGKMTFDSSKIQKSELKEFAKILQSSSKLTLQSFDGDKNEGQKNLNFNLIKSDDIIEFNFHDYVENGKSIILSTEKVKTKDSSNNTAFQYMVDNLLFNPQQINRKINSNCELNLDFEIRSGVVIRGKVSPPMNGVEITILNENKETVIVQLLESSEFKFGPFLDTHEYEIVAEKQGYRFNQEIKSLQNNVLEVILTAQRLSSLKINVKDINGKSLPNVTILVSSTIRENMLKISSVTDENGDYINKTIIQGEYLVRAMLREYSFEPFQKIIKISEGTNEVMDVVGKRIQFSIFGKVINLNQDGVSNVVVHAYSDIKGNKKIIETTTTDSLGDYRLRALKPGSKYIVSIKKNSFLDGFKPNEYTVEMPNDDVENVEFIAFEKKYTYSITGAFKIPKDIDFSEEVSSLEYNLYRDDDLEKPLNKPLFSTYNFFEYENLEKKKYIVKATHKKWPRYISQETYMIEFDLTKLEAGEYELSKEILLTRELKEQKHDNQGISFLGPLVILILLIAVINMDKTVEIFSKLSKMIGSDEKVVQRSASQSSRERGRERNKKD